MKYNKIVTISRKIRKELGLVSKKNGYFDWQFYGEEDEDIELNFYWSELSPQQLLDLAQYMCACEYKCKLKGGLHDFADKSYQICLVIFVPNK